MTRDSAAQQSAEHPQHPNIGNPLLGISAMSHVAMLAPEHRGGLLPECPEAGPTGRRVSQRCHPNTYKIALLYHHALRVGGFLFIGGP